jgi:hypothetical protein
VLLSIETEKFCSLKNYPVLSELTLLQLQLCDSALQQLPWRQHWWRPETAVIKHGWEIPEKRGF